LDFLLPSPSIPKPVAQSPPRLLVHRCTSPPFVDPSICVEPFFLVDCLRNPNSSGAERVVPPYHLPPDFLGSFPLQSFLVPIPRKSPVLLQLSPQPLLLENCPTSCYGLVFFPSGSFYPPFRELLFSLLEQGPFPNVAPLSGRSLLLSGIAPLMVLPHSSLMPLKVMVPGPFLFFRVSWRNRWCAISPPSVRPGSLKNLFSLNPHLPPHRLARAQSCETFARWVPLAILVR